MKTLDKCYKNVLKDITAYLAKDLLDQKEKIMKLYGSLPEKDYQQAQNLYDKVHLRFTEHDHSFVLKKEKEIKKYEKIIADCAKTMTKQIPEIKIQEDLEARVVKLKEYMNK
tara:strand:- start:120 stop:455 length:336 start_codon:yes stop_codon:yes gene_type:complete